MKQRCQDLRFRIDAGEVWSFPQIAIDAGKSKILGIIAAAVLARPDVLDLESGKG